MLKEVPEVEGYKVLEPCVLYAKVGEGGMGAVYRGRHLNLDIDVAIKCLKNVLAEQSPNFVTRFQREARIAASVHHQNLVQVYDISHKNGVHYLVMEFVRGETARERVTRKHGLKETEACKILLGAAAGLAEAHAQKIVHRDIKPDNILISFDGKVKVSDLGLAKALEVDAGPSITMGVMGTPQYMAPEQWDDNTRVGPTADVWALGATFYYLLTGEHAIPGGSMQQIYKRICVDPFPDIREKLPGLSENVRTILQRCVERDPKKRFADCRELVRELSRLVIKDPLQGVGLRVDAESGTMRVPPLLSPPPAETLGHIKVAIQGEDGGTMEVKRGPGAGSTATPAPGGAPSAPEPVVGSGRSGARWAWSLLALPVLIGAGWFLAGGGRTDARELEEEQGAPAIRPQEPASRGQDETPSEAPGKEPSPRLTENLQEHPDPLEVDPSTVVGDASKEAGETPPDSGADLVPSAPPPEPIDMTAADMASTTTEDHVVLEGRINRGKLRLEPALSNPIELDPTEFEPAADGTFEKTISLPEEGTYGFTLRSVEDEGKFKDYVVTFDRTPPVVIVVQEPPSPINRSSVDIVLSASDDGTGVDEVRLTLAGKEVPLRRNEDRWSASVPLEAGSNTLSVTARDAAGNSSTPLTRTVVLDVRGPGLASRTPLENSKLRPGGQVHFELWFDEPVRSLEVNGAAVLLDASQRGAAFERTISTDGATFDLSWKAVDALGNPGQGTASWPIDTFVHTPKPFEDTNGFDDLADGRWAHTGTDPDTGITFVLVPSLRLYFAETEVTRGQWRQGFPLKEDAALSDQYPVTDISWKQASEYCKRWSYALPSEEAWAAACLAGRSGPYSCMEKELEQYAWFNRPSEGTSMVKGNRKPNGYGLFDMHGNVWEWCATPGVARGGSFVSYRDRIAFDYRLEKNQPASDLGFRPVIALPPLATTDSHSTEPQVSPK